MDSLITAAGRALAAGDPLGALKRVALRNDAPALALRGIAMAQLGDLARARFLLRSAVRAFSAKERVARARCIVAEAEIALAARDLQVSKGLPAAVAELEAHGDRLNAAHGRYVQIRRLLLIGRVDEAEQKLAGLNPRMLPPASSAGHELIVAGIAMRRLRAKDAREALTRAQRAAHQARIPALAAEVESALRLLHTPAARLLIDGRDELLVLEEIEALLASKVLVVDACRYMVSGISLATRPVLFTLARELAQSWPEDVPRDRLVARAFGLKLDDESHRARLRVEIGRLRTVLRKVAEVSATRRGFALLPRRAHKVAVLAWPTEEKHSAVLALLADGESWSSSALALALGTSQRTVQRALDSLAEAGKVQSFGRARTLRWTTPPMPGFATTLLLPAPLPVD
jgi:hypothetical protein